MSKMEKVSEEMLQLPIDELSLDVSPLKFEALQKATSELEIELCSTDGGIVNAADTLALILTSYSLVEIEVI